MTERQSEGGLIETLLRLMTRGPQGSGSAFDQSRPVDLRLLARILRAACRMPSGHGLRPTRFVVVCDPRVRKRLSAATYGQRAVATAPVLVVVLADLDPIRAAGSRLFEEPLALGSLAECEAKRRRALAERAPGRWSDRTVWVTRPAGVAAGAAILGARAIGLDVAWIEDFDHEGTRSALGIPDDHAIVGLLALGFRQEDDAFPSDAPSEVEPELWFDHFGQPEPRGDEG